MQEQSLGLAHFWAAGDVVTHSVAYILLIMSVISWYYILSKALSAWRLRRSSLHAVAQFWSARSLDEAIVTLKKADKESVFAPLAEKARSAAAVKQESSIGASVDRTEVVTRALRQEINQASARLESGLTLLASVGATAPFIGLFGTVWGIYHALLSIAGSGQVLIDKVAGPVGEALVMTAAGLAVAIPAVLAYNGFTRVNRLALAELDGFAYDLLALLTTGTTMRQGHSDGLRSSVAMPPPATQTVGH